MKLSNMIVDQRSSVIGTVKTAAVICLLTGFVVGCSSTGGSKEGFEPAFVESKSEETEPAEVVAADPVPVKEESVKEVAAKSEPEERVIAPEPEPVPAPIPAPKEVAKPAPEPVKKAEPAPKPQPKVVAKPEQKTEPKAKPEPVKNAEKPKPVNADTLVANLAPKAKPKPKKGGKQISRKNLPARFELWELKKGSALLDKDIVITTPTWQMGEPGYNSQIWVTVMDDKVMVYSSSDFIKKTAGIKINGGTLIRFSNVIDNNIGVLEGDYLGLLSGGGKMEIYMGFFPGKKPTSKTYKSEVSLDGLGDAIYHYSYLK